MQVHVSLFTRIRGYSRNLMVLAIVIVLITSQSSAVSFAEGQTVHLWGLGISEDDWPVFLPRFSFEDSTYAWQHNPIGERAGAPTAAGEPTSHAWDGHESEHVFFRGENDQLHELWWRDDGQGWRHNDIGSQIGAPRVAGDPVSWEGNGSEHVYYRSVSGDINELWWRDDGNGWRHIAIGVITGAPSANGDPASHAWLGRSSEHVFYCDEEGNIHELWWRSDGQGWRHNEISMLAAAPPAAGDPTSHAWEGHESEHVFYRGEDGHIHELWWRDDGFGWRHNAVGELAGAPRAAGDPTSHAWEGHESEHVFYRGEDGHIHELWWRDDGFGWRHNAIGEMAKAPLAVGDPASHAWEGYESEHVFYRGEDGSIHELWWRDDESGWRHNAIGMMAGAPLAGGDPTSHAWEGHESEHVFYRSDDGRLHELWWHPRRP